MSLARCPSIDFAENENKTNNLGNFQIHELGKD